MEDITMNNKRFNLGISFIIFMILAVSVLSQTVDQLYQNGLLKENGEGNLQEAISIYEKIVADESAENSVKAKAQLHIGLCYEKLGKTEAINAYELVLQNYQNYKDEVHVASLRLSELNKDDDEDMSVINLYQKVSSLENSSLSPDGTKLVGVEYDQGQNIAVYDRLTNQTQMLTKYDWLTPGHGWTYFPIWSPDGKEIVYQFGDYEGICQLQVSTLEGKTRTLLKNESSAAQIIPRQWSQDGSDILTFKQDTSGFYTIGLVPAKGGSFKALYKTRWKGRFVQGSASLSPDEKFVVFGDGQAEKLDLFIVDTEGGTPTVLSDHPANEYSPLWSPDGKHIVFIRETRGGSFLYGIDMLEEKPVGQPFLIKEGMQNVDLMNWTEHGISYVLFLDMREIYTLPINPETGTPTGDPKPLDYTPTGSNICPVWSHDGKYLAFISYAYKPEVVIMLVDGGETHKYAIPTPDFWAPALHDLRWLPDNSGVGFNVQNSMGKSTVYRLDIVTGKWQNWLLPIESWTRTEWGPDENSFVYAKWKGIDSDVDVQDPGMHQFNIKTGETHNIFRPDDDSWYSIRGLKFSRDYKKLTFSLKNKKLMVLDLESGKSRMLVEKPGSPTFSPDGQKILVFGAFGNGENDPAGMAVLSLDGKILQRYDISKHFTSGTRTYAPDWSPDGKQLVFNSRNMKYETYLIKNVLK